VADVGAASGLVLAAVFAAAGLAKVRRPSETAVTLRTLGLPAARVLARAVPAAELGLAAALVLRPRAGALVALAMLAAFSIALAGPIRRGSAVSCGCFGSTGRDPVGPADLVRNGLLAVLALPALAAGAGAVPSLAAVITAMTAALIALVALALVRMRLETS
jgi:uncharacterized membrane protein YphA (DoxX/SURF4 family)